MKFSKLKKLHKATKPESVFEIQKRNPEYQRLEKELEAVDEKREAARKKILGIGNSLHFARRDIEIWHQQGWLRRLLSRGRLRDLKHGQRRLERQHEIAKEENDDIGKDARGLKAQQQEVLEQNRACAKAEHDRQYDEHSPIKLAYERQKEEREQQRQLEREEQAREEKSRDRGGFER